MEPILLRQWRDDDVEPFAAMNADAEVMRHFPALLTREQSEATYRRLRGQIEERGWGLWVLEVDGVFAGFTGLAVPSYTTPFTPCVEVGWRLRREFWGRGLAFRAASQAIDYGFGTLGLAEIVSFTAVGNLRSRRLMERLGLQRDLAGDFEHPLVPEGHALRPHVLYRRRADAGRLKAAAPG